MEIAVVGSPEFTLGFQLAGITHLHNPTNTDELAATCRELMSDREIGIVVLDSRDLGRLPERIRDQVNLSITPTFLGIGTEEDNTLRESIRKALGVDLWK
ncbi:MAG: V-type ATP synthase subunit F [Euryarchaeota archaeon]|nr:V-type ATP synthase subunit F [Euryarchaeota archaeon]|tara:strand:+ start:2074 stop:2373 length:300 start_codon:yes stop_codon:yes gene_type:complete